MFGKVLHNVYQVRVGQQLHPSSIGCKYLFSPTEATLNIGDQTKPPVNARFHVDSHKDSEQNDALDTGEKTIKCEKDSSVLHTEPCNTKSIKPQTPPERSNRTLSKKLFDLANLKKQQIRKNRGTQWYLHHVLPSIQRTTKYHNEKYRNLSVYNEFANRSLRQTRYSRDSSNCGFKVVKQRSLQNANIFELKMTENDQERPNTVPQIKSNKYVNYYLTKPAALNVKSLMNFNLHNQSQAKISHQSGDDNTKIRSNEDNESRNLDIAKKNSFVYSNSDFSRGVRPRTESAVSKYCSGDTPLVCDKVSSKCKVPNQFTRHKISRGVHDNIRVGKQREPLQYEQGNLRKENPLELHKSKEMGINSTIKRNIRDVRKTFSCVNSLTYKSNQVTSTDEIYKHQAPKRVYSVIGDPNEISNSLKTAVDEIERITKRGDIDSAKSKPMRKTSFLEYHKKSRLENSDVKQNKYHPEPLTHSSVRVNISRLMSTPPACRKNYEHEGEKSKTVRKTKLIAGKKSYDEGGATDLVSDERQNVQNLEDLTAAPGQSQKTKANAIKRRREEHWENNEEYFNENENMYGSDEKEINKMKRRRGIGALIDTLRPKSAPKMKTKRSETDIDATKEIEAIATEDAGQKRTKRKIRSKRVPKFNFEDYKSREFIKRGAKQDGLDSKRTSWKRAKYRNLRRRAEDYDENKEVHSPPTNVKGEEIVENVNMPRTEQRLKMKKYRAYKHNNKAKSKTTDDGEMLESAMQYMQTSREDDQTTRMRQYSETNPNVDENESVIDSYKTSLSNRLPPQVRQKGDPTRKNKTKNMKLINAGSISMILSTAKPFEIKTTVNNTRKKQTPGMDLSGHETRKPSKAIELKKKIKLPSGKRTKLRSLAEDKFTKANVDREGDKNREPTKEKRIHEQNFSKRKGVKSCNTDRLKQENDGYIKLPDSYLHKRANQETKLIDQKRRKRNIDVSQTSKSINSKSDSEDYTTNMGPTDDTSKDEARSSSAIIDEEPKKVNKITKSFHDLRKLSFHRIIKKSPSSKSVPPTNKIDIPSKTVIQQWRARFQKLVKSSLFGKKE